MNSWNRVYVIHVVYITIRIYICRNMKIIYISTYKYVSKFMHMHMTLYHEYESVYESGSNAFELFKSQL